MASVYRRTDKRPVPTGAEILTRKGKRFARYTDKRGRTRTYPIDPDDPARMLVERRCWYIAYEDSNGKRCDVKGYTDKEASEKMGRDLEKAAERRRSGLEDAHDPTMPSRLFDDALDAWLDDLRRRGKSKDYVYNMGLLVRRLAVGCGWKTLGSVRSDSLNAWLATQTHLAARSSNQYAESARAFLNWCCGHKPPWLPGNPLDAFEPADETVKRREKRALTLDELDRLKRVSGRRWPVYLMAALTGLRRSELKRLQWGDVHLDAEPSHIQLRAAATKAKRADTVAINPELLDELRRLRPAHAAGDQRVFKSIPKYATYRKDVEVRAKIPWRDDQNRLASFHALRKTFATYLALADVPLRVAMDMMRVTDAKLLNGVYTDAKLFNTSAAAARLPRLQRPDDEKPAQ
jgi:integrase